MKNHLLEISNLTTTFDMDGESADAVRNVSLHVDKSETLGIVGESGCGKSMTALSIMRLVPPPGRVASGKIMFKGEDLLAIDEDSMREVRGNMISMIFQEPMTSLNPVFTIGDQISEAVKLHQNLGNSEARNRTIEMLKIVGIPEPEKRIDTYPHQLSGGMRQRAMIAMALSCEPDLLIADEPTTALDVTIQAQIMELLKKLQGELGMAILLITHDLGIVAESADRVIVMYAGHIVEEGTTVDVLKNPAHPYTRGLLQSVPRLDTVQNRLSVIKGTVPDITDIAEGCPFGPRCPENEKCNVLDAAALKEIEDGHFARCYRKLES